jgi:hypothetical protein
MKSLDFCRYALTACAAAAMLAGCDGSRLIDAPSNINSPTEMHRTKRSQTFTYYYGSEQYFRVPKRVKKLTVTARCV